MQSGRRLAFKGKFTVEQVARSDGVQLRGGTATQVLVTLASLSPNGGGLHEVVQLPARKRKFGPTWKIKGLSVASVKLTIQLPHLRRFSTSSGTVCYRSGREFASSWDNVYF